MSEVQPKASADSEQQASNTLAIPASGVYDPELQLSGNQIEAMKDFFTDRSFLGNFFQTLVVEEIVSDLLVKSELDAVEEGQEPWVDDETIDLLRNPKVVELIGQAAALGSNWQMVLTENLSLPSDEWLEYATPPATFAERLKSPEATELVKNLLRSNPESDFSEQLSKLKTITGQDLELEETTIMNNKDAE